MKKRTTTSGRSKPQKLDQRAINDIIERLSRGEALQDVAERYRVSQVMIQKIRAERYTSWQTDVGQTGPQEGEHPTDYFMRVSKKIQEKESRT